MRVSVSLPYYNAFLNTAYNTSCLHSISFSLLLTFCKGKVCPVAVPDKIFGLTPILDFIDRGHSLGTLYPFGVPDIFLAEQSASSAIDPGTRLSTALSATGSAVERGRHWRRSPRSPYFTNYAVSICKARGFIHQKSNVVRL